MIDQSDKISKNSVLFSKLKIKNKFIYDGVVWVKINKSEAKTLDGGGLLRLINDVVVNKVE